MNAKLIGIDLCSPVGDMTEVTYHPPKTDETETPEKRNLPEIGNTAPPQIRPPGYEAPLNLYRWAYTKFLEAQDARHRAMDVHLESSRTRGIGRKVRGTDALLEEQTKFIRLMNRYWEAYRRAGGQLEKDAVDQAVHHSRRTPQAPT